MVAPILASGGLAIFWILQHVPCWGGEDFKELRDKLLYITKQV